MASARGQRRDSGRRQHEADPLHAVVDAVTRSPAGASAVAATVTSANAVRCSAASAGLRPSGSPNTTKPPITETTVVAAVITTITGTGRPRWSPRWNAKNAAAVAIAATRIHTDSTSPPVTALIATSAAP